MLQSKSVRPLEQYLEDMELVSDSELIESLIESKKDLEAGKGIPWEEIIENNLEFRCGNFGNYAIFPIRNS